MTGIRDFLRTVWGGSQARRAEAAPRRTGPENAIVYARPTIAETSHLQAAIATWEMALVAAAPPDGPLTPSVLGFLARDLALRGAGQGLIEVGADGDVILTPMRAWANNGVWNGHTIEPDGRPSRAVEAPGAAVFDVALPARAPRIRDGLSSADILTESEASLAAEASTISKRIATIPYELAATTTQQLDELTQGMESVETFTAAPPGTMDKVHHVRADPSEAMVKLREQLLRDIEALFGLGGILTVTDAAAIQALWRVATVRTFVPIARLIEAEAGAKLDRPYVVSHVI